MFSLASGWSAELPPDEALQKQWEEARKLSNDIYDMLRQAKGADRAALQPKLEKMLAEPAAHHPVVPHIHLALASLLEADAPDKALEHVRIAVEYPIKTDQWNFGQQEALQRMAAIYERQGKYREAVDALQKWRISEPCGTGAAGSQSRKLLKMLELRLHYEDSELVFADLWKTVGSNSCFSFGSTDDVACTIRALYGDKRRGELAKRVDQFAKDNRKGKSAGADVGLMLRYRYQLAEELRAQLEFIDDAVKASVTKLVRLTETLSATDRAGVASGELKRLADEGYGVLWREKLVVQTLLAKGEAARPAVLASVQSQHNPLGLYVLGNLGGEESVRWLSSRIVEEKNVWALRNYFYALTLTGDRDARTLVEKNAATVDPGSNVPTAAKWALADQE
jgi:tetratricopeptide (TPR) repeat protein